jgi:hypothetical protein
MEVSYICPPLLDSLSIAIDRSVRDYHCHDLPLQLRKSDVWDLPSIYNLLGLSAFAGFVVLLAGWPLNSYVAKRSIRIQKGVSTSRDNRMAVLNELISAVKSIKFFAWEDRWIQQAMEVRGVEMNWMVKCK